VNPILNPVLIIILFATFGYFIAFLSFLDLNSGKIDSLFKTPIYGSLSLFGVLIWTVHHYIKIKTIHISSKGIKLSNIFDAEFIQWSDIKKIELIGKSQLATSPMDANNLILKRGRQIGIVAFYYENVPTIRKTLEQVIECLDTQAPIKLNIKSES
jgi:hypothetical protein